MELFTKRILILFMITIGFLLGSNPISKNLNPGLVKGTCWFISGIVAWLIKK